MCYLTAPTLRPSQVYEQCKILKSDKRSIFLVGIKYKNEDN